MPPPAGACSAIHWGVLIEQCMALQQLNLLSNAVREGTKVRKPSA